MATIHAPRRPEAPAERRTIVIRGQVGPARRPPRPVAHRAVSRPDRVAMWALVMGIFLVLVAVMSGGA